MGFALIFCYGYWCICRFMVVAVGGCYGGGRDGFIVGLQWGWVHCGGGGDGFIAVEVAIVWVGFRWHLGGDWVAF